MASMNRNLNLEEVNSDAFMGIPFLNHQSILQKLIFVGSVVLGVALNLLGTFLFQINANLTVVLTLLPLGFGVAFGCNYNEDLSLIKYLILILFKPVKKLRSRPTEDMVQLKAASERIHQEQQAKERKEQQASPEEQRKLLIRLLAVVVVIMVVIIGAVVFINYSKVDEVHHTVETESVGDAIE